MTTAASSSEMGLEELDQESRQDGASRTVRQLDFVYPAVLLLPEPLESEFWQSTSAIRSG
jgi:hypothetical protein